MLSAFERGLQAPKPLNPAQAKGLRFERAWGALAWLEAMFPAIRLDSPVPLVVGVLKQACARAPEEISNTTIRLALSIYTRRSQYQQALATNGSIRCDLRGVAARGSC